MTTCVFLGPTMSQEQARGILEAVYLPPVRRGDVNKAIVNHQPQSIAIIDGFFEQVPSVWHKEILWAMGQGVAVYGASSMGALRAAELTQFGMVGVGKVFNAYVSGSFAPFEDRFEDDDEVAVVHGPAELGYPSSDAMVDIRATLVAAIDAGVIDIARARTLATIAKAVFYKDRTWKTVLAAATSKDTTLIPSEFQTWLQSNKVSQKRQDAEALLQHIRDRDQAPPPAVFHFEHTLLFESALSMDLESEDS